MDGLSFLLIPGYSIQPLKIAFKKTWLDSFDVSVFFRFSVKLQRVKNNERAENEPE